MRAGWMAMMTVATTVCVAFADPKIAPDLEVPTVPYGLDKMPTTPWPIVAVSMKAIVVEGKAIISLHEGAVDPSEKQSGALGIKIPRLTAFAEAFVKAARGPVTGFTIAMDKALPFRLLVEVISSLKSPGVTSFAIVGHTKELGVVPVTLPSKSASSGSDLDVQSKGKPVPPRPDQPIKMAIAMTKDKILVWSISGLEGTLNTPKLTVAHGDTAKVTAALAEIVKRRFATKRPDGDRSIVLMADAQLPMQDILATMVAIRTDAAGKELFPDVVLSSGFE